MMKIIFLLFVTPFLFSLNMLAAKLVSYCAMNENGEIIKDASKTRFHQLSPENVLPLASVSKLFTTTATLNKFNKDYKFITQAYIIPLPTPKNLPQAYHVHIKGSGDPYFNSYKMHMLISRLNEASITNIQLLTFDENVKYLHDTDAFNGFYVRYETTAMAAKGRKEVLKKSILIRPTVLKAEIDFPTVEIVKAQLEQTKVILNTYHQSYLQSIKSAEPLFTKPLFQPKKVDFLPSNIFTEKYGSIRFGKNNQIYILSQDIQTILKSMNWNSNNFAANRLFDVTGGVLEFNKLFQVNLNFKSDKLKFLNGSGQNHALNDDNEDGVYRKYNEADCYSVLKNLVVLRSRAQQLGLNLYDIMSVVGVDKGSTVGKSYVNNLTEGAIVAKTGTVGTNITLAGVINTENNSPVYFMYNTEIRPPRIVRGRALSNLAEERNARSLIFERLNTLVKSVKAKPFANYVSKNPLMFNLENYDEEDEGHLLLQTQQVLSPMKISGL